MRHFYNRTKIKDKPGIEILIRGCTSIDDFKSQQHKQNPPLIDILYSIYVYIILQFSHNLLIGIYF